MLSIFADALMTATRMNSCGGWPDCQSNHAPKRPRPSESSHKRQNMDRKWFNIAGER